MKDGTNTLIVGPPRFGKTTFGVQEGERAFRKTAVLASSCHPDLAENLGMYAVHAGLEEDMIVDRQKIAEPVPNYQSAPIVTSIGIQQEQDMITVSDNLRQAAMVQRGFDVVHEHPWAQEGLTFAMDAIVFLGLPLLALKYVFRFGHPKHIQMFANAPRWIREKLAEYMALTKSERDRILGLTVRLIGQILRGPDLRERYDHPGPKIDLDDHFTKKKILLVDGSRVSDEQSRMHTLFLLIRAITGAMTFGYPITIIIDEAAPLLSLWLIRKLEEARKFGISVYLLMQHLPADPEIRGRLLKACNVHIWYACTDPEERKIAVGDMIGIINRHKVRWTQCQYVQLRGPEIVQDRITESRSESKGKDGGTRVTKSVSLTKIEKQLWKTFIQEIPHFEQREDLIFDLEQRLAGLGVGERAVVDRRKGIIYFHQSKKLRPLFPGCPGLAKARYRAALERMEARPYFRNPVVEEESCGAATRLRKIRESKTGSESILQLPQN